MQLALAVRDAACACRARRPRLARAAVCGRRPRKPPAPSQAVAGLFGPYNKRKRDMPTSSNAKVCLRGSLRSSRFIPYTGQLCQSPPQFPHPRPKTNAQRAKTKPQRIQTEPQRIKASAQGTQTDPNRRTKSVTLHGFPTDARKASLCTPFTRKSVDIGMLCTFRARKHVTLHGFPTGARKASLCTELWQKAPTSRTVSGKLATPRLRESRGRCRGRLSRSR